MIGASAQQPRSFKDSSCRFITIKDLTPWAHFDRHEISLPTYLMACRKTLSPPFRRDRRGTCSTVHTRVCLLGAWSCLRTAARMSPSGLLSRDVIGFRCAAAHKNNNFRCILSVWIHSIDRGPASSQYGPPRRTGLSLFCVGTARLLVFDRGWVHC